MDLKLFYIHIVLIFLISDPIKPVEPNIKIFEFKYIIYVVYHFLMLNKKVIKDIYKSLFLIREAELTISRIYNTDKIKSPVHLSIGQEPIAVGICKNLKKKILYQILIDRTQLF